MELTEIRTHRKPFTAPKARRLLFPTLRGAGDTLPREQVSLADKRPQLSTINKYLNSEVFLTGAKRFPAHWR